MTLLVLHAAVTLFMLGVIFVIQLVQYPLLADIGQTEFNRHHAAHMSRMGFVAVPMVLELGLGVYIAFVLPMGVTPWLGWMALGTLVIVWVSTFALQVPAHNRLAQARNERDLRIVVRTNWIRTAGWTVRSVLALVMVVERL